MFIYEDSETGKTLNFLSVKRDISCCILTIKLCDCKDLKYQFKSVQKMDDRIKYMLNHGILVKLNGEPTPIEQVIFAKKDDSHGLYKIIYSLINGSKVVETFAELKDREAKYSTLKVFGVKTGETDSGTSNDYDDLVNKPAINSVLLTTNTKSKDLKLKQSDLIQDIGWITQEDLPEIEFPEVYTKEDIDNKLAEAESQLEEKLKDIEVNAYTKEETYNRDEIDKKLRNLSGTKVLVGTTEKPIIADELEDNVYLIEGVVQSSIINTQSAILRKAVYSVYRDINSVTLFEENQFKDKCSHYIFLKSGTNPVESGSSNLATKDYIQDYIKSCTIDGGLVK